MFDNLKRSGGKKSAVAEILDSDESMAQELGNTAPVFSMDIYFVGENYDEEIDDFVLALEERYSMEMPGILRSPRWGDIDVMPFGEWEQSEKFVSGAMRGNLTVKFIKVFPAQYPTTDGQAETEALQNIDKMTEASASATESMKLKTVAAISNVKGKLSAAVGAVSSSLKSMVDMQEGLITTFENIQEGINSTIDDVGGNIVSLISATQYLMRLPAKIKSDTLSKINGYKSLITELIAGFDDPNEISIDNKINNAVLLELIGGMAAASLAEAAVYTDFETRSQGAAAIEIIQAGYQEVLEGVESSAVQGLITKTYTGDHNYLSLLQDTISRINAILLDKNFDLKTERKIILSASSDVINLCHKYYGDVENPTLNKFIKTNGITDAEFYEIPAGREIVVYGKI